MTEDFKSGETLPRPGDESTAKVSVVFSWRIVQWACVPLAHGNARRMCGEYAPTQWEYQSAMAAKLSPKDPC
jgi:hypothetical protein